MSIKNHGTERPTSKKLQRVLIVAVAFLLAVTMLSGVGSATVDHGIVFPYQLTDIQGQFVTGMYSLTAIQDTTTGMYYFAGDKNLESQYRKGDDRILFRYPYATFTRSTNGAAPLTIVDAGLVYHDGVTTTTFEALPVNDVDIVGLLVTYPNGTTVEVSGASFTTTDDLTSGDYKLKALFNQSKFVAGTPETIFLSKNTATFTLIDAIDAAKKPFINITSAPESTVKGSNYVIDGFVDATTTVMYYLFGTNYFYSDSANVLDSKYKIILSSEQTKRLDPGQYFLVIQHPGSDRTFNIAAQKTSFYLNETGSAIKNNAPNGILLFDTSSRQKTNAAQTLCDELDKQNIDDLYVKTSFIVGSIQSSVNPIPYEITKGSKLTISGSTNMVMNEIVNVEMIESELVSKPRESVPPMSLVALTAETDKDGKWFVDIDTTSLKIGKYAVSVSIEGLSDVTAIVNVIEGAPVDSTKLVPFLDPLGILNDFSRTIAKGSTFIVSGQSGLGGNKLITVNLTSVEFMGSPIEDIGSEAFTSVSTKTDEDGIWAVEIDTSGLDVGQYYLMINLASSYGRSTYIDIVDNAPVEPTQPTQPTQPIPTETQIPTDDSYPSGSIIPPGGNIIYSEVMGPGYSDLTINPSTDLAPGDTVTATFKVNLPAGSIDAFDTLNFKSQLEDVNWNIDVFKRNVNEESSSKITTLSSTSNSFIPSMFSIFYGDKTDVTLFVSFSGKVGEISSTNGRSIQVFKALCSNQSVGELLPPSQIVYETLEIMPRLTNLEEDIEIVQTRAEMNAEFGVDISDVITNLSFATEKLNAAKLASSENALTASADIIAGYGFVLNADRALALAQLNTANTNLESVNVKAEKLTSLGKTTESAILTQNVTVLRGDYDRFNEVFNSGSTPNIRLMYQLVLKSFDLRKTADEYLSASQENTPQNQATGSSSSSSSSGTSTWATTTPTTTPTPTETPVDITEKAPTGQVASTQPTKPTPTPVPIIGLVLGGLAVMAVLRRK